MRAHPAAVVLLLPMLAVAQTAPAPPTPSAEPVLTLLAAGDVTLGARFEDYLAEREAKDGWTHVRAISYAFERIRDATTAADLFVVNLEGPFTWRGRKLEKNFAFRAKPELSAVLADGGVDAASLANNHLFDYGADGLADTITTLRARGIAFFGAGMDEASARAPAVLVRNGIRVAMLGYLFLGDGNIEPKVLYAAGDKPGIAGAYSGVERVGAMVEADVRAAAKTADVVIPFFHWGREAQDEVLPWQKTLARRAVDAGAKLVLGSHPHVVHGVEVVRGVPVVYSMGNFVFGGNWGPRVETAVAVRASIGRAGVRSLEVLPVKYTNPPDFRFQPRWLEGAEAKAVLDHVADLSAKFDETLPALKRTAAATAP